MAASEAHVTTGPMVFNPAFVAALSAAQGDFKPVTRSRTVNVRTRDGGTYTFAYAPLETILHAIMPALSAHGFFLTQRVKEVYHAHAERTIHYLVTMLLHPEGCIENEIPILLPDEVTAQVFGSAQTYARRMGVTQLFCLAADDDEDGNQACGNRIENLRDREPARQSYQPNSALDQFRQPTAASTKREPDISPQELAAKEGQIVDASDELIEAAIDGRRHGIEQIWNEIKGDEFVAKSVWMRVKRSAPDAFRIVKEVLAPNEHGSAPRGERGGDSGDVDEAAAAGATGEGTDTPADGHGELSAGAAAKGTGKPTLESVQQRVRSRVRGEKS